MPRDRAVRRAVGDDQPAQRRRVGAGGEPRDDVRVPAPGAALQGDRRGRGAAADVRRLVPESAVRGRGGVVDEKDTDVGDGRGR